MADGEGETELDWGERPQNTTADSLVAMDSLLATLRGLEDELRQQEISEASSTEYCNSFCQALMQYAGSRNSMEHGLPLLEVYCLSITCFAAARPHLTADSDKVALVLKRLSLSCFELLLSVPENEIPYDAWMQFHRSVQAAHNALQEYGSTDLEALLQITGEGGAWSNPVLIALLTGQHTNKEEVDSYIALEGDGFMEMRIKHLVKVGDVAKAMILAKACADCGRISNCTAFRQTYVSHLCDMLPSEEAIMEISRVDGREILEIICNLETEGQENVAFILCTTYLTQQLQHERLYCSWELTLFWSKLQRRIDSSLESFLEHCLQLGAIAKTVYHLLFLVRVIQTEAEQLGLAASVELCVRALQLPREEDSETKTSVCKTVACLLLDDLEVRRACQLTEFLLSLSKEAYDCLEELYLRPDQKYDEENAIIPNSLRCELLLALKAHWPFDPEFWDWKTLKRHCVRLLGLEPEAEEEEEEEEVCINHEHAVVEDKQESSQGGGEVRSEEAGGSRVSGSDPEVKHPQAQERETPTTQKAAPSKKKAPGTSERYLRWQKYKFFCLICQREVIEARILHHSRKHVENGVYTCPVCLQKFHGRQEFVPHTSEHIQMPARRTLPQKKKKVKKKVDLRKEMDDDDLDDLEPGEIALDPSLLMYYQNTQDPDVLEHLLEQAATMPRKPAEDDYITFEYIDTHFQLQDREVYPCPATNCAKNFKHFKYLSVHLKAEHDNGDDNVKHYLEMKDRREKCTFCRRHFMTAYHHRKHRRVHYGDQPYMCVVSGCGARFNTTNELIAHKQSHGFRLSYRCELKGCSLAFCDLGQLYHHEAQHFRDAAYSCTNPGCKKFYYSKKEFLKHLATHGITFTEEDFIAQRKRKRKPADPFMEDLSSAKKPVLEELLNDAKKETAAYSPAGTSFQQVGSKEPKGTLTCVAVCFDGKKFTCGFESCGRTFTQARDIQRHLKCVHPGQLKSEKKGQKRLSKEKSTRSKDVKGEQSGQDKSAQGHSACLPAQGSGQERSCSPAPDSLDPYVSPPVSPGIEDPLRDILLGLSQLSLKASSPRNSLCDPCHYISGSSISQVSCPPTASANSPAKAARKKAASKSQPGGSSSEKAQTTAESLQNPPLPLQMDHQISSFLVQPSTKPYACEVKGCGFKSVTSSALMGHYVRKHSFSKERVKGMEIFRTKKFKPFKCHLCPKGYRQKSELRIHFLQMHNISEAVVEQMSCSLKRREEGKATEPSKPKVSLKQSAQLQKKQAGKLQKDEPSTWQRRYPKKKGALWMLKSERENGILKSEDKNKKADVKAKPPPALQDNGEEEEGEERTSREGRGSRRLVAKGNLCYILTKYHKPFHCVHKDCTSAFTHQSGLVRHLQTVHRYNRSQLCLEEDLDLHHSTGVKRETAKPHRLSCKHKGCGKHFHSSSSLWRHYRSQHTAQEAMPSSPEASEAAGHPSPPEPTTPISEEPIPQFRCCYGNCNATYHLYSSLLRHTTHVHRNQAPQKLPPQQVHCKFEGCTRVFTQNSSYKKHVFYRHCDYYDSLVLRLQNAHKKDKSASGCQKKLIVNAAPKPAPPQKDAPKLPLRHSLRHCPKSQDAIQAVENIEEIPEEPVEERVKAPRPKKRGPELVFRTHEEALQMCQDRCLPVAYPCMVQDCDSVLTVESSMRRHYLRCHKMSCHQFSTNQEKLVNNAEQLEELIQKKSALSARPDMARAPNGVLKVEYQAEPEKPGGPSLPMSLHSIKADPLDGQDPLGFSEEMPAESNVLVGADDVLYGEKNGHSGQEDLPTQSGHGLQSPMPPLVPPPLDLPPPSSLRFTVDEGFMDCSSKECGGRVVTNASVPFPVTPTRQPLKRKNELSEPPPTSQPMPKDSQPLGSAPRTFDLTAYKPMGFESSFLKFIQESKDKEDEFEDGAPWGSHPRADPPVMAPRRRDSHRRNCSVKENSQRGLTVTRSRRSRPSPLKPLLSAGEYASVQNLRSILDRALTGCGDLAIKQLQYLRPVVVLERSKFSTSLLDLFPTKKPEKLLRGSS